VNTLAEEKDKPFILTPEQSASFKQASAKGREAMGRPLTDKEVEMLVGGRKIPEGMSRQEYAEAQAANPIMRMQLGVQAASSPYEMQWSAYSKPTPGRPTKVIQQAREALGKNADRETFLKWITEHAAKERETGKAAALKRIEAEIAAKAAAKTNTLADLPNEGGAPGPASTLANMPAAETPSAKAPTPGQLRDAAMDAQKPAIDKATSRNAVGESVRTTDGDHISMDIAVDALARVLDAGHKPTVGAIEKRWGITKQDAARVLERARLKIQMRGRPEA
jgi:hypothetical protein